MIALVNTIDRDFSPSFAPLLATLSLDPCQKKFTFLSLANEALNGSAGVLRHLREGVMSATNPRAIKRSYPRLWGT